MTSSARRVVLASLTALASLVSPARAQTGARLSLSSGDVAPRLAARVADAVSRLWDVDPAALVLSWGSGSLARVPDSSAFQLLGQGEDGWFALVLEPAHRPQVAIRVRAGITRERTVATRPLRMGARLDEADFRSEPHLEWGRPDSDSLAVQAGWVVRRPVAAGDALDHWHVSPPPLVVAGQPVRLLWNEGNVTVALEGVALHDAALGQPVRIRTGRRTGVLLGTVTANGEARMN
jgi:flagella basal body P-ring formation protein FlgA